MAKKNASQILGMLKKTMQDQLPRGIELATVTNPPPALQIRIDNMKLELSGDDLIVCEHLLDHTRAYSTSPAVSGSTETQAGTPSHTHQIESLAINGQAAAIKTNLQTGDRVAVLALPGEQQYLVFDKVVVIGA